MEYRMKTRDKRHEKKAKRPMRVQGRGLITVLNALEMKRERERRKEYAGN